MPEILLWQGRWRGNAPDGGEANRAREVVRYTGGIVRGKFPSRKMRRMVHHEGLLELDVIYLFEVSPLVVSYREQPVTIQYSDQGKRRRYTPDFEVTLADGTLVLVEVKPYARLQRPDVASKFKAVRAHFKTTGQPFVILDDTVVRQGSRLKNAKTIWHRLPRIVPTCDRYRHGLQQVMGRRALTLAELEAGLGAKDLDPYGAMAYGLLRFDMTQPLQSHTVIYPNMENENAFIRLTSRHGF